MSDRHELGLPLSRTQRTVQRGVMEATSDLRKKNLVLTMALSQYVVAQGRMRDQWSEASEERKQMLWRDLHSCEEAARKALSL